MTQAHFILYVADQAQSAGFYEAVLDAKPRLNVPGMTEFELAPGAEPAPESNPASNN